MGCGQGEVWNPYVIADRIKRGLDVLGTVEGGLLYRGPEYWQILPPGTEGQVLQIVAGVPVWQPAPGAQTLWEDDFFEASVPPSLVDVWRRYACVGAADIAPTVGANGGLFLNCGGTNLVAWQCYTPLAVGSIRGQSQFAECQVGTRTSLSRHGLFVGINTDGQYWANGAALGESTGYRLFLGSTAPLAISLQKISNGVPTNMGASFGTIAAGVVAAVTLTYGSGSNVLEVFLNGVSQGTRTDSSSPAPAAGMPGFGGYGQSLNHGMEFRHFRCGLLSDF